MKRILLWLLIIIVVLLGVSFSVLNAQPVTLDYYFAKGDIPLSIVVVASLSMGVLLGMASSLLVLYKVRRELARTRKKLQLKEKEINNLRAIPLQDNR